MTLLSFEKIGRMPDASDNSAIAVREIEANTQVSLMDQQLGISRQIPIAHRFAVKTIEEGDFIYSWGQPFGIALTTIYPGDYLCNAKVLDEFSKRSLASSFPASPNFKDYIKPVNPEEPLPLGEQVSPYTKQQFFAGFDRGERGVGTRNYIIVLGTNAHTAGFVRHLSDSFKNISQQFPHVDGVVPIAHTEGATEESPNNEELLLRTLSGFFVHPNVGAVLSIDFGTDTINNQSLKTYLRNNHYPLDQVTHQFFSIDSSQDVAQARAAQIINQWLPPLNQLQRTAQPLSKIKIALQCGGSDAFSGVSGNPLAAWMGKEIIRYGGTANLAETDELIGAEAYVLANVRNKEIAKRFLEVSERFKAWAKRHGHSPEGNPSGGNVFRGLYNIAIKAIGAARKRHPDVRLDHVIDYAERMQAPGFYFMDSPGNDPESVSGQVASGANLIYFITGNGSITNFPFVPTIKIMTTTERFKLLNGDIDVNAGQYLEGESLDSLGQKTMELTLNILSGEKSTGEKAGHSQVNIWRNWYNDGSLELSHVKSEDILKGKPLPLRYQIKKNPLFYDAIQSGRDYKPEQIGLVLPTSLCSGEIAKILAEKLTRQGIGQQQGIARFVALAHTEGCGCSDGFSLEMFIRTTISHLLHPNVGVAISLEHGCEKMHNAYMRQNLEKMGGDPEKIGWFSIQLDGGIENALQKATAWCQSNTALLQNATTKNVEAKNIRVGIMTRGPLPEFLQNTLTLFCQRLLDAEVSIVVPENSVLLSSSTFQAILDASPQPTLAYGQQALEPGFHMMATSASILEEVMTGMGGSGVQVLFSFLKNHPISAHPMIPVIQATWPGSRPNPFQNDFDLILSENPIQGQEQLIDMLQKVLSREYTPKTSFRNNSHYQISRGMHGITL